MNWDKGFRRLVWAVTLVAIPLVGALAYAASEQRVGFEPRLLTGEFPSPDDTSKQVVEVSGVGLFYFPAYLTKDDVEEQMRAVNATAASLQPPNAAARTPVAPFAASMREKYPHSYDDLDDIDLTRRILTKYPEYRDRVNLRQFEVEAKYAKRPIWAFGVTLAAVGSLALLLHSVISISGWIVRGFTSEK